MTPETWCPPSGSKLAAGERCPASLVLPRVDTDAGEAAEIGTGVHEFIEAVAGELADDAASATLDEARTIALAKVPADAPWRKRCEDLDLASLDLRPDSMHEVGFRLTVATGSVEFLGTGLKHGDAKLSPGTIVGVFDRVTDRPDLGLVDVDDWKTGFLPVPVEDNLQLLLGAYCAARYCGRSRARVRIVKLPEDGRPRPESADLDAVDLDLALLRLAGLNDTGREQARRFVVGEPLSYVQGEGCRYCPAFTNCAAVQRSLVTLAREPLNIEAEITGAIATCTDEEAAAAYLKFQAWDAIAKRIRVAFALRARTRPIPFSDGTVYGERQVKRTKMDGEAVYAALVEAYDADTAALAVKKKATKKGITAVARELVAAVKREGPVQKGTKLPTIKDTTAEIFALLGAKGAAEEKTTRKLDRHKAGIGVIEDDEDDE